MLVILPIIIMAMVDYLLLLTLTAQLPGSSPCDPEFSDGGQRDAVVGDWFMGSAVFTAQRVQDLQQGDREQRGAWARFPAGR